ncbi:MAG: four-carbon acid sugar kinase family protein, partial [Rhodobacteraceae bacterium]|nr:four-carbon acid sugar kinase family protein [Paracoccaceae bacterium]
MASAERTPRIAWLGDDFTGSAAVMEVLTFAGLPSVLFTGLPDAALAARFAGRGGVGIATTARSHGPDWMEAELPPLLRWLDALGPALLHYKICSTFDSAPEAGSIGRAIEVALRVWAASAARSRWRSGSGRPAPCRCSRPRRRCGATRSSGTSSRARP